MTPTATSRTSQRQNALDRANVARHKRCELKHELHALNSHDGCDLLAGLLLSLPVWLENAKVDEVLDWPCRIGPVRVRKWLNDERFGLSRPHGKKLAGLSERQRGLLAGLLRGDAG